MAKKSLSQRSTASLRGSRRYLTNKYANATMPEEVAAELSAIDAEIESRKPDPNEGIVFYTTMGHLFEFYVYAAIKQFSQEVNGRNWELGPLCSFAQSFKLKGGSVESPGGAAESAYNKVQEWKQDPKYVNSVSKAEANIILGAEGVVQNLLGGWLREAANSPDPQKLLAVIDVLSGKSKVDVTAIADTGGKGNPVGDLVLSFGGRRVILELKWQTGQNPYAPVTWFSGVADSTLFGANTFSSFLDAHQSEYWNYKRSKVAFIDNVINSGLFKHLQSSAGSGGNEIASFLIKKGNVSKLAQENPLTKDAGKITLHLNGNTADVQFSDMTIPTDKNSPLQIAVEGRNRKIQLMATVNGTSFRAGAFWASNFYKGGDLKGKYKKDELTGPSAYSFSFEMYVTQKFLQELSMNLT